MHAYDNYAHRQGGVLCPGGTWGPDLTSKVMEFIRTSLEMRSDAEVVLSYGRHFDKTRDAAWAFDGEGRVTDATGWDAMGLWMCGHFVAKAYQPLLEDL